MRSHTALSLLSLTAIAILSLSGTGAWAADCDAQDADGNCIGQTCGNIGESTLDNDQTKVIVCLRSVKDGPLVWKSMSPSASEDNGCQAFSMPITIQGLDYPRKATLMFPIEKALNGQKLDITRRLQHPYYQNARFDFSISVQCIAGTSAIKHEQTKPAPAASAGDVWTFSFYSLYDGSTLQLPISLTSNTKTSLFHEGQ